eukprot:32715_1
MIQNNKKNASIVIKKLNLVAVGVNVLCIAVKSVNLIIGPNTKAIASNIWTSLHHHLGKKRKLSPSNTSNTNSTGTDPIIHTQNMDLFWKYIIERHSIHKKRTNGEPSPWTTDEILLKWKFTNVFRDIDPGTQYVIHDIITHLKDDFVNLLFNIIIYRVYNKINTMNEIGLQDIEHFVPAKLERSLRQIVANNQTVFTNAFVVPSYRFVDPNNKYDKIGRTCVLFERMTHEIPHLCEHVLAQKNSEETYKALLKLPGLGKFLAYQICVDVGYWNKDVFDENEFVVAGPGAINGLKRIFEDRKGLTYGECIQYLCDIQEDRLLEQGCDMNSLFEDRKDKCLNLMAMQNCLCEISKYLKAYYEEGRPKNKY